MRRTSIWACRHAAQSCCPFNFKFAKELKEPAFRSCEFLAGKDAGTLADDLLAMSQVEFRAAFKGAPIKRATRRGLARNAAVALGSVGRAEDVPPMPRVMSFGVIDAAAMASADRWRDVTEPAAEKRRAVGDILRCGHLRSTGALCLGARR